MLRATQMRIWADYGVWTKGEQNPTPKLGLSDYMFQTSFKEVYSFFLYTRSD